MLNSGAKQERQARSLRYFYQRCTNKYFMWPASAHSVRHDTLHSLHNPSSIQVLQFCNVSHPLIHFALHLITHGASCAVFILM